MNNLCLDENRIDINVESAISPTSVLYNFSGTKQNYYLNIILVLGLLLVGGPKIETKTQNKNIIKSRKIEDV